MVGEKTIICDLGSKKCRLVLFAKMGVDVWVWGFLLCKYQVSETREKVAGTPYTSKKRKKERKKTVFHSRGDMYHVLCL